MSTLAQVSVAVVDPAAVTAALALITGAEVEHGTHEPGRGRVRIGTGAVVVRHRRSVSAPTVLEVAVTDLPAVIARLADEGVETVDMEGFITVNLDGVNLVVTQEEQ